MSETSFQFWRHNRSGEIYAVRFEDNELTGVCGALPAGELSERLLPYFHYDDQPEGAAWAREHKDDFSLYEVAE